MEIASANGERGSAVFEAHQRARAFDGQSGVAPTLAAWVRYDRSGEVPLLFRNTFMVAADIVKCWNVVATASISPTARATWWCILLRMISRYGASKAANLKNKVASRQPATPGPSVWIRSSAMSLPSIVMTSTPHMTPFKVTRIFCTTRAAANQAWCFNTSCQSCGVGVSRWTIRRTAGIFCGCRECEL